MQAEQGPDIEPDDVRRQLEHMIVSDVFRGSPQLSSFLSYVVEAVLQGRTDRIKGYTIGVEVLRRDTKFDPQLDPIVRVEAGRLRRAMERYYAGPGQNDDLIIDIPRGSYVPVFRRRVSNGSSAAIASSEASTPAGVAGAWQPRWVAAAAILLVAAGGAVFWLRPASWPQPVGSVGPQAQAPLPAGNGMPNIAVTRFQLSGNTELRNVSVAGMPEKLREALSAFEAINVVEESPGAEGRIDYRLDGVVEYRDDGTATLRFRLTDVQKGNLVWTQAFTRLPSMRNRGAAEDAIVSEVSNTLLQPYGVLRSYARTKNIAGEPLDPRYRCILISSDAIRSYDPADYRRARTCLEALTAQDRGFADGFSYLAILYNREFLFELDHATTPPLDRSLRSARRAIELKPNSSRAHHALATVLFYRGELSAAFAEFEKAMALNGYDSTVVADYGGRLISAGEVDRGVNMLRGAMTEGGVIRASWQHFSLFLAYYARNEIAEATQQANLAANDTYLYGLAARAAVAVRNGNIDLARQTAERMVALRAAWRDDPDGEMRRMIPDATIRGHLVQDLAAAGLGPLRPASGN
jgi:tetratricopeptide (TPR) repeat protein